MPWSRKEIVVAGLLAGLTGLLLFRVLPYFHEFNVAVGDRAPDFDLTADDGTGLRLRDYQGKYVLLNFWATWCPPCVEEMPSLNNLHNSLADRGLVVVGISADEDAEAYRKFIADWGVTFPTVRDPERSVSTRYGTFKYPETYLIDRQGNVIRKYVGPEDWNRPEIQNYLRSLL